MIKKIFVILIMLLIFLGLIVNGYSTDIDGTDSGIEWDGATSYLLVDGESNCGVNFGVMKLILDNENRAVFFCFVFVDPELEQGNSQTGVSLSIENSEPIIFTAGTSSVTYDTAKYSFDGAISIDSNNGATCEVRLGFKSGLPRTINGCVRFIDSYGLPSNEYAFSIINEGYTDPTAAELRPTADNSDPAYNPGLLTEKTTKNKTATTKSAYETENNRNNDNRITTTKRVGYTTEEFVINTSPPYSYERTTKLKTTQTMQNNKSLSKTNKAVTIYYYEKEIIISEVYISEKTKSEQESEKSSVETGTVTETTINLSDIENETAENVFTDGTKYKNIVAAVSATLIILLAAWASKGGKKEK